MKRFIIKTFLFALPWLLMLIAAEMYVEQMPNISRDKHQWMLEHSRSVKTLVLGHSHTLYGVRPDMLEGAFSLAQQSQTYRYDAYLLKHYPMDSLRIVILPFNYSSLWEDFESQPGEEFQAIRYRIYMDCDIHPRLSKYGFEVMHFPLVREKLKSLYSEGVNEWDSLGWATDYTLARRAENWDNGHERAESNTYTDERIVKLNVQFLTEIFDYCKDRGVCLLLVNTPVSPLFRKYEEKRQVDINNRELASLLKKYPEVRYVDLEEDNRFEDADFFDGDHLSTQGATRLTSVLCRLMNEE